MLPILRKLKHELHNERRHCITNMVLLYVVHIYVTTVDTNSFYLDSMSVNYLVKNHQDY